MELFSEHSFVICAYKESVFLEDCVCSLLNQKIKSKIVIATSTPNEHISAIASKYDIPVFENEEKGKGICADWNYGVSVCNTRYVTIAHQDDIYLSEYSLNIRNRIKSDEKQIIFFTNYAEIIDGKLCEDGRNLGVKRILCKFFNSTLGKSVFVKRRLLSVGNAICCPAVTFDTDSTGKAPFVNQLKTKESTVEMKFALDWLTWETLARKKGEFVYIDEILMHHRRHPDSETAACVENNVRAEEDLLMLKRFWISPIAKIIRKFFSKA